MAWAVAHNVICSAIKGATWATAAAFDAANLGFRAKTFAWNDNPEQLPDMSMNNSALRRESSLVGNQRFEIQFTVDLKYEGLGLLIASMLGTAATVTGANPYAHDWYHKDTMTGVFISLGMYDGLSTHTWPSVKLNGMSFKCKAGGLVEVTFKGIANRRTSVDSNAMTNVTELSTIRRVQSLASTNTYQTAAIASALATLDLIEWSVDFEREYAVDKAFTSAYAPYIREPMSGELNVTGSLETPYEVSTFHTAALAGSLYKLQLTHTATASAIFTLGLPSLNIEKVESSPSDRAGAMTSKWSFRCDKAVSTPSDMEYGVPFIVMTNTISTNALA